MTVKWTELSSLEMLLNVGSVLGNTRTTMKSPFHQIQRASTCFINSVYLSGYLHGTSISVLAVDKPSSTLLLCPKNPELCMNKNRNPLL
jgi:hypothetical protein